MKRLLALVFMTTLLLYGAGISSSGVFGGKWWNYYERGLEASERSDWQSALDDLRQSIRMRDQDQRMARTYGMHFVEYFPHRELGIVYFNLGNMELAVKELELSITSEETAKASFYLNKVKAQVLQQQKATMAIAAPVITVVSPAAGSVVKTSSVVIKGKAAGAGQIARITINDNPYWFDRARETREFVQEVPVEDGLNGIVIAATDLMGIVTSATITITVDRDGPSVQIFDVKQEQEGGKTFLRLIGEVSDATWISKLQVNGRTIDAGGEKTYPLSLRFEQGSHAMLKVEAVDPFENETAAEIDVEKSLAAFNRPFEPFLIALNADKLIGFDKKPPEMTLKASAEIPTVFSDKYCVEGMALDNLNIGRIVINNKEVFARIGKQVYFSKVVDLREGRNTIAIDVYDTSDNKISKSLVVTRKIPSVMQNAARMSITLLPFDSAKAGDRVQLAYDQLISAFVDQKRFSIIERAKLDKILMEQKLTKEKLTDPEQSIRLGKLISADAILATTVREDDKSLEIVARVISTETSEVLSVKDVFAENKGASSVREIMANLAAKIAIEFPVAEGMVVKAGGRNILMDVGETSNMKKNMTVIVFRRGEEIRHPVTGKSLGFDTIKLAEGRIEEVQPAFSKVRLLDKPGTQEIRVKDLIITK